MANTTAATIATSSPIEGEDHMIKTDGKSAATCKPGDLMVQTGAGVWTLAISTTALHAQMFCGVVGYRERILASGAQSTINDNYEIGDLFPVITGFKMGKGLLVIKITDPAGTIYPQHGFVLGAVSGDAELSNTTDLGGGFVQQRFTNIQTLLTGDLYMLAEMS